jgi:hypothetical protein
LPAQPLGICLHRSGGSGRIHPWLDWMIIIRPEPCQGSVSRDKGDPATYPQGIWRV